MGDDSGIRCVLPSNQGKTYKFMARKKIVAVQGISVEGRVPDEVYEVGFTHVTLPSTA
ncbi:MAG: hypothetical protein ACREBS_11750 [Nitrososphaerales archaeon]